MRSDDIGAKTLDLRNYFNPIHQHRYYVQVQYREAVITRQRSAASYEEIANYLEQVIARLLQIRKEKRQPHTCPDCGGRRWIARGKSFTIVVVTNDYDIVTDVTEQPKSFAGLIQHLNGSIQRLHQLGAAEAVSRCRTCGSRRRKVAG